MSHQRTHRKPRCLGCGLPLEACVCSLLPRKQFSTPFAIVQHVRERWKPTNTGRLFCRMVEDTVLLPCGMREPAFDPGPLLDPGVEWWLLYPREGSPRLDERVSPASGRRLGLVLLDGSWSQCAHMSRRLPVVSQLPCVSLPPGPPSFWTVRTQHCEGGRSTFEAGLSALHHLEGAEPVAELRRAFAMVTARILHLKGKLRSPEIPASWAV